MIFKPKQGKNNGKAEYANKKICISVAKLKYRYNNLSLPILNTFRIYNSTQ